MKYCHYLRFQRRRIKKSAHRETRCCESSWRCLRRRSRTRRKKYISCDLTLSDRVLSNFLSHAICEISQNLVELVLHAPSEFRALEMPMNLKLPKLRKLTLKHNIRNLNSFIIEASPNLKELEYGSCRIGAFKVLLNATGMKLEKLKIANIQPRTREAWVSKTQIRQIRQQICYHYIKLQHSET